MRKARDATPAAASAHAARGEDTVAVIIPSWNGLELLQTVSLPSLRAQTYRDFGVIVVDNGSTDRSVQGLAEIYPGLRVVSLPRNLGFAAAVNCGIRAARSRFIVLLNNDVELAPDWLEVMVHAAEALPDAGFFAGKTMQFHDRRVIDTAGDCVTVSGHVFKRGYFERDEGQYETLTQVFGASAAATLCRRHIYDDVGLFDEDFFAYYEDVDICYRAQLRGYACWYIPTAISYHVVGATSSSVEGLRWALMTRNLYWLLLKNVPASLFIKYGVPISVIISRRFYRGVRSGHWRATAKALYEAASLTPKMLQKRKSIQHRRRVSTQELEAVLICDWSLGSETLKRVRRRLTAFSGGTSHSQ